MENDRVFCASNGIGGSSGLSSKSGGTCNIIDIFMQKNLEKMDEEKDPFM